MVYYSPLSVSFCVKDTPHSSALSSADFAGLVVEILNDRDGLHEGPRLVCTRQGGQKVYLERRMMVRHHPGIIENAYLK